MGSLSRPPFVVTVERPQPPQPASLGGGFCISGNKYLVPILKSEPKV
jgi:hypothetical protein